MTILAVLLSVVLSLALYLLFAPFYLEIDSTRELYRLRFHRLASCALRVKDTPALEVNICGWKKEIELKAGGGGDHKPAGRMKASKKRGGDVSLRRIIRVFGSFKVSRCYIRLDLGDMQLNGILYPVLAWLRWYLDKDIMICFTGASIVKLEIENNLARMSRAWFGSDK